MDKCMVDSALCGVLQKNASCAYLQTDMQRAPQAADPSRLLIRLELWAGESQGRRRMAR